MKKYLYSGAGNSFVLIDGRALVEDVDVVALCKEFGTDGLMLLKEAEGYDFAMDYYNSDGSSGMMCGNGGRCIVAFAAYMGISPASDGLYRFIAPDGQHEAHILENKDVRLKMIDVCEFYPALDGGYFLNTGTRHYVKFVADVEDIDIEKEGAFYRHHESFAPIGVNANFVSPLAPGHIKVRTFEKGVEAETLACGTGITASAIASYLNGQKANYYIVQARKHELSVSFNPVEGQTLKFTDVYLTGPAELVKVIE